ncbi:uncharacterized protein LDX57_012691 [Aspergillus melleus]|uniref:uncharacterized protein n=1 Tax=Aspergillus melleus TaxID=138277 RepID=UPI001E8D6DC2|nr:uncharacterized protein LDX57_012691 [Aspergillus melleus]KAH8435062.1 hypothetical protein LDX57_012691 [Aspergillus melleus]
MRALEKALMGTHASSDCWATVHNETVACFSGAPIAFSFDMDTAADCQHWCGEVEKCHSWLYVAHSSQCDLHRNAALSTSFSSGFTFGGCAPTLANATEASSDSSVSTSTRVATEPTGSPEPKRGADHHRRRAHGRHHR